MAHPLLQSLLNICFFALRIHYHLHAAWRFQSLGKVRLIKTLKTILAKLWQETSESWTEFMPTAFLRIRIAPKRDLQLSLFEMVHGRAFFTADLLLDSEMHELINHLIDLGQI